MVPSAELPTSLTVSTTSSTHFADTAVSSELRLPDCKRKSRRKRWQKKAPRISPWPSPLEVDRCSRASRSSRAAAGAWRAWRACFLADFGPPLSLAAFLVVPQKDDCFKRSKPCNTRAARACLKTESQTPSSGADGSASAQPS